MGISLLDCVDSDSDFACQKIYDKITSKAENLVKVGKQIETEYEIPIANKRVTVTPIALIAAASNDNNYVNMRRLWIKQPLGLINNKTTAARLIPVSGKNVGDEVNFGGLLGHAPIMATNPTPSDWLINRSGLISAPIHSFKN